MFFLLFNGFEMNPTTPLAEIRKPQGCLLFRFLQEGWLLLKINLDDKVLQCQGELPSVSAKARMNSGFVPQQPPIMSAPAFLISLPSCANSAGVC
jgi:hypothetical protein